MNWRLSISGMNAYPGQHESPTESLMIETQGDIWDYASHGVIVITTNGSLTRHGLAVPGNGVTRQATGRYPWLAEKLGRCIREQGNHVCHLDCGIVSFPVEETAWSQPDLRIIVRSAKELRSLADAAGWQQIVVPRPGCGGGGLLWKEIKPLLEPWFDGRFLIISSRQPGTEP